MKRLIELTEEETTLGEEIHRMFNHPDVQQVYRKRGYVDFRIKAEHWSEILRLLLETGGEG